MTTTTISAIITQLVTVLEALTPEAAPAARKFTLSRAPNEPDPRRWTGRAGGTEMFRRFCVRVDPGRDELGIEDPRVSYVATDMTLTVAYPAVPSLLSLTEFSTFEQLISTDADQLIDAIRSPSALVAGHQANVPGRPNLDRARDDLWLLDIPITSAFYTTRRP